MHIGLIVGIGPAATDFYYRSLIASMTAVPAELELTMVHADTATLLAHQAAGDVSAQVGIYDRLARRLAAAGARSVAVTSIAGHFCIEAFKDVSVLPVIDLVDVVSAEVGAAGYQRVGLIGTRGVMTSHFFGALEDVALVAPRGGALDDVHDAYVQLAATAACTGEQRQLFVDAGRSLVQDQGAEAVLLAGTDLVLAFRGFDAGFPVLDCAAAHVRAIVAEALRS